MSSDAPRGGSLLREIVPPETGLAFAAMRFLRPDIGDEASFVDRIDNRQRAGGYRLVGAFKDDSSPAVAVAGFRLGESLAWGRHLYVDDLSTAPEERRHGHGRALLDWLVEEARRSDCGQLHLDSGVGPDRADAHRLYLNAGLVISSHHFARYVEA
jgi:GNAT superfamily N-acetyltransferase